MRLQHSPEPKATIRHLPNELIVHILTYLDGPSSLEKRIKQNSANFYDRVTANEYGHYPGGLKAASLVCHAWRHHVLPSLFRHVLWVFQRLDKPEDQYPGLDLPLLKFLRRENLINCVETLTMVITYPKRAIGVDAMHSKTYGVHHCGNNNAPDQEDESPQPQANQWLWDALFAHIDPIRITIVASPAVLCSLLGLSTDVHGGFVFQMRFHILSLERTDRIKRTAIPTIEEIKLLLLQDQIPNDENNQPESEIPAVPPKSLFTIRPWSSLLVNEGSFIPAYKRLDWDLYPPPTILTELFDLYESPSKPFFQDTFRSFSYIAIFPIADHVVSNIGLMMAPKIEELYIQLTPQPIDTVQMFQHDILDFHQLWRSRDETYAYFFDTIFHPFPAKPWRRLRVFETGDSSDSDAWNQAALFIESRKDFGWEVESEGRIVKQASAQELPDDDDDDDDESTFSWDDTEESETTAELPFAEFL